MTPIKNLLKTIALAILAASQAGATVINGVDWQYIYNPGSGASVLPDAAKPPWTLLHTGGSHTVNEGVLTLATEPGQRLAYRISEGWDGNATPGMTLEARVRVEPRGSSRVASIAVSNARQYIYLNLTRNTIFYSGGKEAGTLADGLNLSAEFNTLRLTLSADLDLTVYLNDDPTPVGVLTAENFSAGASAPNGILFGVAAENVGGISHWEYVAWTPGIHPVTGAKADAAEASSAPGK